MEVKRIVCLGLYFEFFNPILRGACGSTDGQFRDSHMPFFVIGSWKFKSTSLRVVHILCEVP